MDKLLFILVNTNKDYLKETVPQIKKLYPDSDVCIVNNNQNDLLNEGVLNQLFGNLSKIMYINNKINNYELGAYWLAYKTHSNYERYILLHNRSYIIKNFPDYVFEDDFVSFWQAPVTCFSPAIPWCENKLREYNIEFTKDVFDVCQGMSCSIKGYILKKMVDMNFDKMYALNKNDAVGTEILFTHLIKYQINVDSSKKLNTNMLSDYIKNKVNYEYIKYIGGSQSHSSESITTLPVKFTNIDDCFIKNKNYTNNDILIEILNYCSNNSDLCDYLLSTNYHTYKCPNIKVDISIVLKSIRHLLFTKKYFKEYYDKQYQDIINRKLSLF